jgi:hypothetical protein
MLEFHGGCEKDLLEEYIAFAKRMAANEDDAAEKTRVLKIFKNYRTNPGHSTSYVAYADKYPDNKKESKGEFGIVELKRTPKDEVLSLVKDNFDDEDDPGVEIIDPVADVDEGFLVRIRYNSKETDNRKKFRGTAMREIPLSDDQLKHFDKQTPLNERFGSIYDTGDFDNTIDCLEEWEKENGLSYMQEDEWLEIVEECRAMVNAAPSNDGDGDSDYDGEEEMPEADEDLSLDDLEEGLDLDDLDIELEEEEDTDPYNLEGLSVKDMIASAGKQGLKKSDLTADVKKLLKDPEALAKKLTEILNSK